MNDLNLLCCKNFVQAETPPTAAISVPAEPKIKTQKPIWTRQICLVQGLSLKSGAASRFRDNAHILSINVP